MDIKSLHNQVSEALAKREYGQAPEELYEPIRYFVNLGGKRLRPILCLLSHHMFTGDYLEAFEPALGIELFHNFTLLHDDLMDDAPLRRGKPTVHEKWNDHVAILSGDAMFVKSYQSMAAVNAEILPQVLAAFSKAGLEVCEGQQYDMNFETRSDVTVDEYLEMIRLKTAVLLGFSLELGAIIARRDDEILERVRKIGVYAGIGFQLMDDLLDVFGEQDKVGKQVGGDIIANKKTYLILKALELADEAQKKELNHWFTVANFNDSEKVEAVKTIYHNLDIKNLTAELVNNYFDRSLKLINTLTLPEENKKPLVEFLVNLMQRDY